MFFFWKISTSQKWLQPFFGARKSSKRAANVMPHILILIFIFSLFGSQTGTLVKACFGNKKMLTKQLLSTTSAANTFRNGTKFSSAIPTFIDFWTTPSYFSPEISWNDAFSSANTHTSCCRYCCYCSAIDVKIFGSCGFWLRWKCSNEGKPFTSFEIRMCAILVQYSGLQSPEFLTLKWIYSNKLHYGCLSSVHNIYFIVVDVQKLHFHPLPTCPKWYKLPRCVFFPPCRKYDFIIVIVDACSIVSFN